MTSIPTGEARDSTFAEFLNACVADERLRSAAELALASVRFSLASGAPLDLTKLEATLAAAVGEPS